MASSEGEGGVLTSMCDRAELGNTYRCHGCQGQPVIYPDLLWGRDEELPSNLPAEAPNKAQVEQTDRLLLQ